MHINVIGQLEIHLMFLANFINDLGQTGICLLYHAKYTIHLAKNYI